MYKCRLCGSNSLTRILDLGTTPPADRFLRKDQLCDVEPFFPLVVVRCDGCFFVQLNYVVPPKILYQEDYPYESSTTQAGRTHFEAFAASVIDAFSLSEKDLAVDIGSNVGILLKGFQDRGCRVLGIDPANNIAQIARDNGIPTLTDFFGPGIAERIVTEYGKASVITASNVFAHIDDLSCLMTEVKTLLTDKGVFIVEAPYLMHLIENLEYDTIYHEHLSYLSIMPLVPFFERCGFTLFDIKQVDIHGGSIRLFICKSGRYPVSQTVADYLKKEEEKHIHSLETFTAFANSVVNNKNQLRTLLADLKAQGNRIAAVSAPAKGMTLLNYCGIGSELIEFVTEKSELKIGKFTPGTHLPVKDDGALLSENIDYALLLAWNFKDEIMKNLAPFTEKGGHFIIPIPKPIIAQ